MSCGNLDWQDNNRYSGKDNSHHQDNNRLDSKAFLNRNMVALQDIHHHTVVPAVHALRSHELPVVLYMVPLEHKLLPELAEVEVPSAFLFHPDSLQQGSVFLFCRDCEMH